MLKRYKERLAFVKKNISQSLAGPLLFFLFFLYGLANNMSLSYMGNRSEKFEELILEKFLGDVIIFLLKILSVYMLIGLIIGIVVQLFLLSYACITNKEVNWKKGFLINFLISGIIFAISFMKDIIVYPQVYMNNFYLKNNVNKYIVDFMTDNINPLLFSILQIIIVAVIFGCGITVVVKAGNKIINRLLLIISIIIFLVFLFKVFEDTKPAKSEKLNVIILASDALRPDHISGYGYFRDTTPNIDRLISDGISFQNTFIEVPRTFPSWISILTGQFASTHGIRHMFPTSRDVNRDFKTIVKIFKEKGYYTSIVTDFAGDVFSRIDMGFEKVDTPYFNFNYIIEQAILDEHTFLLPFLTNKFGLKIFPVLKDSASFCPPSLLRDRVIGAINDSGDRPFFITAFFSSTHFPYSPPYPYYKLYSKKDYKGPYKYYKQKIMATDSKVKDTISREDIEQIRSLYDAGLKAFDDEVGNILKFMTDKKILNNTIILILSDHGENLYEKNHGMGHGEHFRGYYSIKIPLIIRLPGSSGNKKNIYDLVRHVDIAPTILTILNETVPEYMEGVSLLPLIKGDRVKKLYAFGETGIWFDNKIRDDLFFQKLRIIYPDIASLAEIDFHFDNQVVVNDNYRDIVNLAKHRYVYDGRFKLIYMPLRDRVVYEMYDTRNDPQEVNDISEIDKQNMKRLKRILFEWIERNDDVYIKDDYVFPILRY